MTPIPIPQPEVTLRLPHADERVIKTLDRDTSVMMPSVDDELQRVDVICIIPAGTTIHREVQHAFAARWIQDIGWIFSVQVGPDEFLWVRPASDLAVSPVTWEEVPLVYVEAPAGTPE